MLPRCRPEVNCSSCLRPIASQLSHPADQLTLDRGDRRRHLGHRERVVDRSGEDSVQMAAGSGAGCLVAEVHRMGEAIAVRKNIALEMCYHLIQWTPASRHGTSEPLSQLNRA